MASETRLFGAAGSHLHGSSLRSKMVEGTAEIGVVEFLSSRSFERAIESGGSKFDLHSDSLRAWNIFGRDEVLPKLGIASA